MKILIVHNFYQMFGGEDAVVRQEAELLAQNGEDVSMFAVHNDDIEGFWAKIWTGATVAYNPVARKRLSDRLRADRPDIVHVHNFFPQISPSIFTACAVANIPCVMTLHNFRILCPSCFLYHDDILRERSLHNSCWWTVPKRVYRDSFVGTLAVATMVEFHKRWGTWRRSVDRFVALSPFAKSKFVEGGLPAERVVIKDHSVSVPSFPKEQETRHGALFVGRLSEQKGLRSLVEAWKSINYPLKIIGDGPLRAEIEATNLRNIKIVGNLTREQIYAEMRKASFLVLPSLWSEMFGLVAVEAFACELPVIASNLLSLQDTIIDGMTGLYFQTSDSNDLAEKVNWAISHPLEMQNYARNAQKKYKERYTPEINYRNLMTIYHDVIRGRGIARK